MFGIGLPELLLILAIALIVLGPEQLPKVARQLARLLGELRKAGEEFKEQLDLEGLKDIKDSVSKAKLYPEDIGELKTPNKKRKAGKTDAGTSGGPAEEAEPQAKAPEEEKGTEGPEIQTHGGGESQPAPLEEGSSDTPAGPRGPDSHSNVP